MEREDIERALAGASDEYSVHCEQCRYTRLFGNAPVTADVKAVKHKIKTGHPVTVLRNGVVIERKAEIPGQQSLDDVPPF